MDSYAGQRATLAFDRSLLRRGATMAAVGTALFLVGATLGGAALLGAGRRYLQQIDERPTDMARRQWRQLRGLIVVAPKADLPTAINARRDAYANSSR
jgi:hypothetical protein